MDFLDSLDDFRRHVSRIGIRQFLLDSNLLPAVIPCTSCAGGKCRMNKTGRSLLFYRCSTRTCRRKQSIKKNTVFDSVNIRMEFYVEVLVMWFLKYPPRDIIRESSLVRNTVYQCLRNIRELVFVYLEEMARPIGGPGVVVEIDETVYDKRRYNLERVTSDEWLVSGICRESRTWFLQRVEKPTAQGLRELIEKWVLPGSVIVTDTWQGCMNLNFSLEHFVEPDVGRKRSRVSELASEAKKDLWRRYGKMSAHHEILMDLDDFRRHVSRIGIRQFLLDSNLLPAVIPCTSCAGGKCRMNKTGRSLLFYRCSTRTCRRKQSIKKNTVFDSVNIRMEFHVEVLVMWFLKYPPRDIIRESSLERKTVYQCLKNIRELVFVYLEEMARPIGGPGAVVEIDETVYDKRRYNLERVTSDEWLVSGICRENRTWFLQRVEKPTAQGLRELIEKWVLPGSVIVTDAWQGCMNLNFSLEHFVEPDVGRRKSRVSELASEAKKDLWRRYGKMSAHHEILMEYMWRTMNLTPQDMFLSFVQANNLFFPN
ncbi:unnamed protein product [Phyllotreta striolata]|uniref:Transposase n=1 Tax=Phyllotreta striolata TaxID=444603 RepID=A0A9N9XQS7_PHYSR|nr:unnamed protein product [Phyllotreta striolata]